MLKRLISFMILLMPALVFALTPAEELTQQLSNMETVYAHFTQSMLDKQGHSLQTSRGKMFIQRPGKFRWEIHEPSHQLLIADGQKIWFYDIDLKQVTVQNQKGTAENTPAMLLSGSASEIANKFIIISNPSSDQMNFELRPKRGDHLFQSVRLFFKNNQITAIHLKDNMGQSSRLTFNNVKMRVALSPRLFEFIPPRGVDVIKQ